jgi:hypothetical protein
MTEPSASEPNSNQKPSLTLIKELPTFEQFLELFRNLTGREPSKAGKQYAAETWERLNMKCQKRLVERTARAQE